MSEILDHIPKECHGYFDTAMGDRGVVIYTIDARQTQLALNLCMSIKVNGRCAVTLCSTNTECLTDAQLDWFDSIIEEKTQVYAHEMPLHPYTIFLPNKDINDIFSVEPYSQKVTYTNSGASRHVILRDYYYMSVLGANQFMIDLYNELVRGYEHGRVKGFKW